MQKLKKLIKKCKESDSSLLPVVIRLIYYRFMKKNILANDKVIIKGLENIETHGLLEIGMGYLGFMHKNDVTYLNVRGKLIFEDKYAIGKGCRFDIGEEAVVRFGKGYVNGMTNFMITHGITVGDGCAISWGCEFLDEDFHQINYPGKKEKSPLIEIGNRVWIGSNVTVLKGSKIPDGCVVASGSIVTSVFHEPNCLIAGNPAKEIKENVTWETAARFDPNKK
jgi:acetyltransferase-like isoleucine patch superfamily enzyme